MAVGPVPQSRAQVGFSILRALGALVILSALITGCFTVVTGWLRGNLPIFGVGIAMTLASVFGWVALSRESPRLTRPAPSRASNNFDETSEMDPWRFAEEQKRRKVMLVLSAIPLFLVTLLLAWSAVRGQVPAQSPASSMAIGFVFLVLGVILVAGLTSLLTHGRFAVSKDGFIPRKIPLGRALRGKRLVKLTEVKDIRHFPDPAGEALLLQLADGRVIALREQDGIPRLALEKLRVMLSARGLSSEERSRLS